MYEYTCLRVLIGALESFLNSANGGGFFVGCNIAGGFYYGCLKILVNKDI